MSNVVTSGKFALTSERLASLKESGVLIHNDTTLDDLDLKEPGYGDKVVGEMTDDETLLLVELFETKLDLEDLSRERAGLLYERTGHHLRTADRKSNPADFDPTAEDKPEWDKARETHYRLQAKIKMLQSNLYWSIGERLDIHHLHSGIRSKGRIVTLKERTEP
jgi:hypothetical protein